MAALHLARRDVGGNDTTAETLDDLERRLLRERVKRVSRIALAPHEWGIALGEVQPVALHHVERRLSLRGGHDRSGLVMASAPLNPTNTSPMQALRKKPPRTVSLLSCVYSAHAATGHKVQ